MGATVVVNGQTVVHKDSGGVVTTTDVCKTPMGKAVVPIPYVNVARSVDVANGSATVSVDSDPIMLKDSVFSRSSGDEAGSVGGVVSGVTGGKARFVNFSNNVFVEGRPVCRRLDPMISNLSSSGNTPPAPLMQPNLTAGEAVAEPHSVAFATVFAEPDVLTGSTLSPDIAAGYTLQGPEEIRRERDSNPGVPCRCGSPGEYSLTLDDFQLKRQSLTVKEQA